MNAWKVIVPTLVIFIAGIVTGALLVTLTLRYDNAQQRPKQVVAPPFTRSNRELLERMDSELDLTPEQHTRIKGIMADSQKRVRWELQQLHLAIAKELTPEQRKKFEGLTRPRMMERRHGTNSPANGTNTNAAPVTTTPY
ncbi:MAG TPA: hypothetical protein VFB72_16890 [Verrucomicrobiae bacterium]|nr:hypothetical protein [Verrucomicrobiae bacterium]